MGWKEKDGDKKALGYVSECKGKADENDELEGGLKPRWTKLLDTMMTLRLDFD